MSLIRCKMCGADLNLQEGLSVVECEFCGSRQTVPNADNEKKLTLFGRANRLRMACDFDKAAGVYESLVADFPEEAEAYWGLVLCKYGIEYVDDPASGKKIPTCHRSSYDSVMDDDNFEQAMENADVVAQRVYREEAKQLERIRKGILEVSANEQPYDIFICYKETDEKGGRTLDSVLAQDLYMALTDKGYRVFFSRITLQGKLGEAYEPYIFAALNSAKVMLAVGTCYEYYNAVWVKNEWSRYLKICEADKGKYLIPCYKDMDPEDMPKEFNHLQGADLGQMGAIQNILFNMEKYIPLKKETTTVIQRGFGVNIEALLKRGTMALEDGDWEAADKFFEEVLNQEAECADAYLGKVLVKQKCRNLDSLVSKHLGATQSAKREDMSLKVHDQEREQEIISRWHLKNYLQHATLKDLFRTDSHYHSSLASRKLQYTQEQAWFQQDPHMSRALRYAEGAGKQKLLMAQKQILDTMEQRVRDAEQQDQASVQAIRQAYETNVINADAQGKILRDQAEQKREEDYQNYMIKAEEAVKIDEYDTLKAAQEPLMGLDDYKQSAIMAQILQEKIDAIEARWAAERQRIEAAKRRAAEIRRAYEQELPLVKERPEVIRSLRKTEEKVEELSGKLKKWGWLIFCIAFFLLGVVEFVVGLDGDDFLMTIGGICAVMFGIGTVVMVITRISMRKELRANKANLILLRQKLAKIDSCMSLEEFTRVYELRQTERGRAQLEEEARQRDAAIRQRQAADAKARKAKATKITITVIAVIAVLTVFVIGAWYVLCHAIPGSQVKRAEGFLAEGKYQEAYDAIHNVNYANSEQLREQIAQHGTYVVTSVWKDDADYGDTDYQYWITYNAQGLPKEFFSESAEARPEQMTEGLTPSYTMEYTWYESGNLQSCAVYSKYKDTYCLSNRYTFWDDAKATVAFLPGAAQSEDMRWQALTVSGMQGWGVKTHSTFDRETGEVTHTTEYRDNGTQTSYAYSEDDQDRVISYHEADAKGETRLTYDKNGFVTERLEVKDRSKPNSSSNDEYIYTRKFRGGDVTEYAMYAYNTKNDPRSKEVYTYDDAGNALTVTFYAREKVLYEYELTKASTYTMTYVWLDYAAAQIQEQQAQAEAQAEAERIEQANAAAYAQAQAEAQAEAERIEQANAAAYAQAEALLEEGNYEAAYDAFLQLGEYNDSHVRMLQVGDILNEDIGKKILETMKTSLEAAYPMLEEVVYESTSLEQIRQLCETYYSVCGDFSFKLGWEIHSDFSWDGETLYWNYKTIKGNVGTPFGIGINNKWVYFFQKPVPVVDGKAVEQINTEQGIMAFNTERGKLEYELGYFKTDGSFKSVQTADGTRIK